VPPLRVRGEDVLLLIRHFTEKFAKDSGVRQPRLSDKAIDVLLDYNWPGNIRELENVIQRLVVMAEDEVIDVPDLPSLLRFSALREGDCSRTLAEMEIEYINRVLACFKGNKSLASKALGIDRKTLREKLKPIK
jgi:DNA-binding NtrC family response regulator